MSTHITLDANAAGHGWYFDWLGSGDDWLPTSNPLEWMARPGSAAEGKMDFLSVFWHEYGHAMGLEHSADNHELMATTLQPGIRRLPSAEELALFQSAAEMAQATADTPQPYSPFSPFTPDAPLPVSMSLVLGALRRRSSALPRTSAEQVACVPQFNIAANTTLNTLVPTGTGWAFTGPLEFGANTATLSESSNTQTRLNQVFVVGENDRFLSFTLKGNLGDQANGPDDAFEVALLNAATGASLLGGTGLTRTDAILNRQANGTEHKASGITRRDNADGSATYVVDLAGIPAGTVVNLGFDLIGFGRGADAGNSSITVRDLRLGPVMEAVDDAVATQEDTAVLVDVRANDVGATAGVVAPVLVAAPQHATVTLTDDGLFRITPQANWHGTDSFTYYLSDGSASSNTATVTFTVHPVNDAPVAQATSITLLEDGSANVDWAALSHDLDGDALSVSVIQPSHGVVTQNIDGIFTYTSAANFNGADAFTYTITDGELSATATVSLTVTAVNDAPVAADASFTLAEDGQQQLVLTDLAQDVDSLVLTAEIVSGPAHGTLVANADGSFTYVPEANWFGTDSIVYRIRDEELESNTATITLTVTPVNDAPAASPVIRTLLEDGQLVLNLLEGAVDVDGDALSVEVDNPAHGQLLRNADGSYTYVPNANFNGEDGFVYRVSDGQISTMATVSLTILAVNDAPVAYGETATLNEDGSITLDLLANDHDVDGGANGGVEGSALTPRLLSQPAHGNLVLNADNTVTYVPATNWSGEDCFTYVVNDGELDSAEVTVRLVVSAVADAPVLVITDQGAGNSRELFRTSWETADNQNRSSTLVRQRELEGWTVVIEPDANCGGGEHGFEIWSSGDHMRPPGMGEVHGGAGSAASHNTRGRPQTVYAGEGNGNNWLELNNAQGLGHQTLGIERTVGTIAGASYELSLDVAGRIGYSADFTRIGIYVDGVRIVSHAATSPDTALDWSTLRFSFTGKGGMQTIRIVTEATRISANGRGAMIDDIALVETLPLNTGYEDSAIRLSGLRASLADTDGSETLSLMVQGLPVGATLSDGLRSFTATQDQTVADVTGWNLDTLTLTPPADFNGTLSLQVVAVATEAANQDQARTEATLVVTVLPVNDAPQARSASFVLQQDGTVRIDLSALVSDVDGDVLTLSLGNPARGKLTRNDDGSYTYTPKQGYAGQDSFSYSVSDGVLTSSATISLSIQPAESDEDCHGDNGRHRGFAHSQHHGYEGCDDRGARLTIQSACAGADQGRSWMVDWMGVLPANTLLMKPYDDRRLNELTGKKPDDHDLGAKTGLVVKVKK